MPRLPIDEPLAVATRLTEPQLDLVEMTSNGVDGADLSQNQRPNLLDVKAKSNGAVSRGHRLGSCHHRGLVLHAPLQPMRAAVPDGNRVPADIREGGWITELLKNSW